MRTIIKSLILVFTIFFAYSYIAKGGDKVPDFSSPESLYEVYVSAFMNKNIELLLDCFEPETKKMLGNSRSQRLKYLKENFETIQSSILQAEINEVGELHKGINMGEIKLKDESDPEISYSMLYYRKIGNIYKLVHPKIYYNSLAGKDVFSSKSSLKTKEIDQPEKMEEMK